MTLAGVSTVARENQTPATVETTCNFQTYTHPCQPHAGPMGLGINGSMEKLAFLALFLMPDSTTSSPDGAIDGNGTSKLGPRLDQAHEMTSKTTHLSE